jgi:hypothetical protein
MANPDRRIKLTRTTQIANLNIPSYTFTVTASDANLMPEEVFVFRRLVINNLTGDTQDYFDRVASGVDLNVVPIGAPNSGDDEFRSSAFTVTFATQTLGETAWAALQTGVTGLKRELDASENLSAGEEVWVGTAPV